MLQSYATRLETPVRDFSPSVIVSGTGGTIVYGTQATAKVLTAAEMQALQTATYIRRLQYLKWLKEGGKGIPPNTGF